MSSNKEYDISDFEEFPPIGNGHYDQPISLNYRRGEYPLTRENPNKNHIVKSFYNKIFSMKQECLERGMTEDSYNNIVDMLRLREIASIFEAHITPKDWEDREFFNDIDLTAFAEITMELNFYHGLKQYEGYEEHEEYLDDGLEDIVIVLHNAYMKNRHRKYLSYSHVVDIYQYFRSQGEIVISKEDLTLACHPSNPYYLARTFSAYFKYSLNFHLPFKQEELWEAWIVNTQMEKDSNVSYPQWLPREMVEDVAYLIYHQI